MTSRLIVLICLLVASVLESSDSGAVFDFDCRRSGSSCLNQGSCNETSGRCNCLTTSGHDYRCSNSPSCEGYYGDNCTVPRVQIFCNSLEMFININPYGDPTFEGIISVYNQEQVSDCVFNDNPTIPEYVKSQDRDVLKGLRLSVRHNGSSCGDAISEMKPETPPLVTYTRRFLVQYDTNIRSALDQIVTAQCLVTDGSSVISVSSQTTTIEDQSFGYKEINVNVSSSGITLEVQKDGRPPDVVRLGDLIDIVIKGPTSIRVENCTARDISDTKPRIQFLTDGCPEPRYKSIYAGSQQKDDTTHTISLKAFRFTGNSKTVVFVCLVTICASKEQCPLKICDGSAPTVSTNTSTNKNQPSDNNTTIVNNTTPTSGNGEVSGLESNTTTTTTTAVPPVTNTTTVPPDTTTTTTTPDTTTAAQSSRRKKRATGGSKEASAVVKVLDKDEAYVPVTTNGSQNVSSCSSQQDYLNAVIVLAVLVAGLIVTTAVLFVLLRRSRSKVLPHHQREFAQPVQTMRLPRLDLRSSNPHQPF